MKFTLIIKILDFVHDILCPFFGDKPKEEEKKKEE